MSVRQYRERITKVLNRIWDTQLSRTAKLAGSWPIQSRGGLVHLFGSGHSVLPVQDMFPRYGKTEADDVVQDTYFCFYSEAQPS